jgi:ribosomal protein S18 acetylase RimI-like enzyme
MATVVSSARPDDAEAIARLLEEMDRFYGSTTSEPLDQRVGQINEALFSSAPAAYALLAWNETELVGIASYSFLWPAVGLTRSLYLKELYVAESARRASVGRRLMSGLFDLAEKHRCSRVEWTTDASNQAAQRFYEELGALPHQSKIFYRSEL